MTKQMIRNIIVLGLVTLLMGGLIAATFAITDPIIKRNQNRALENVAKEFFPESNVFFKIDGAESAGKFVEEVFEELTKEDKDSLKPFLFVYHDDEYLGLVITEEKSNAHGSITLAVAINPNGLVLGIKAIDYSQTPGIGEAALEKYEAEFKNVGLSHAVDAVGGATNSSNTLADIMSNVASIFNNNVEIITALTGVEPEVNPLEEIFGEFTKTLDASFTPTAVILERYIITGDKASGFSYVGSKEYSFTHQGGQLVEGETKLEIFVDESNEVVHYEFLIYEHSPGGFKERIVNYLDKLIGYNLEDIEQFIVDNKDLYANSSETGENVIDVILLAILETFDPLAQIFGDYTKVKDNSFVAVGTINERYVVEGTKANGSSFIGSGEHSFTHEAGGLVSGEVKLEIYLDEEGNVLAYEVLKYDHSAGGFKNRVIAYLDKLVGENILDVEAFITNNKDLVTGSTETAANIVDHILMDTSEAYKEYHPLYGVYGDFTKTFSSSYNEGDAVIDVYTIVGDKAEGESFIGKASHSFTVPGGSTVSGEIQIEFYVDEHRKVLAYEILEYPHTGGGFKQRIVDYLDAFVGTYLVDIEQFIVDNKEIYANSSETGAYVIDVILMGINGVMKR